MKLAFFKKWNDTLTKCLFCRLVFCSTGSVFVDVQPVLFLVAHLCLTLCDRMDCSPSGSSLHGILQPKILEWLPCPPPGDLPNPGIEPRPPTLHVDSLPSEPPGKPMNPGVGSLSLLQGVFLIQELSWCLLHCRQILYQLSYQGSLMYSIECVNKKHSLSTNDVIYTVVGSAYVEVKGTAAVLLCRLQRKGWESK